MMNARPTTCQAKDKARRREEMIALAREINAKFEKLNTHMDRVLSALHQQKAA